MLARFKQWMADLKARRLQKRIEILPPLRPSRARPQPRKPHAARTAKVYAALASAPADATYDELIAHVRAITGRACSRKLIARWRADHPPMPSSSSTTVIIVAAAIACAALVVAACTQRATPPLATPSPSAAPLIISATKDTSRSSSSPHTMIIKAQVERPSDLRVKEGQHVSSGEIIADRRIERAPLESQREQVRVNLALMWHPYRLDTPQLPPAFFADAETAILRAQKVANDTAIKLQNVRARLLHLAKLEQVPDAISDHEAAVRAQLETDAAQAEAEVRLARAQLAQAKAVRDNAEHLNRLTIAQQRYKEDETLQLARLLEAQLRRQLASLDQQIELMGYLRAPFSGTIKRILWEDQTNHDITVTLHLALDPEPARRSAGATASEGATTARPNATP